jgi:uncharacterized protein
VVDATLLAAREATLDRSFALVDLPRLSECATDQTATARLVARWRLVDGRAAVSGTASAELVLTCQRCLGSVSVTVEDEFHLVLVDDEDQAKSLPDQQDVIVTDATRLDLSWLLEEQLLLAMPLVPTHANATDCVARQASAESGATDDAQRPFADLKALLRATRPAGKIK